MTEHIESKIWVFIEQREHHMAEVGFELLAKARSLARPVQWKVAALLIGYQLGPLAETVLSYGADEVLVADDFLLEHYCNQAYVKAVESAIRQYEPQVLLLGATAMGTDLAPRLAARLRTGLSAHCIDLDLTSEGQLLSVVPGWGGNIMACISCPRTRPQVATVMPGVFDMPQPGKAYGRIVSLQSQLKPEDLPCRIVETKREEVAKSGIEKAEVVIAGGWGIGGKSDWNCIKDLAVALNGAVGATRPPVDEGWAEEKQMIGQSGRTVHPRLYIGIGISGHMHHLVGLKTTELTVAISATESALAKQFACEAAARSARKAIEIHGSYGIMKEYAVQRLLRDAVVTIPAGGTAEIAKLVMFRQALSMFT